MNENNFSIPARRFNLNDVRIPDVALRLAKKFELIYKTVGKGVIVHWPNGAPCILINQYLLGQSDAWTGETARTYASDLSHLVRYCSSHERKFSELSDGDVRLFIDLLVGEEGSTPYSKRRNNNTVRRIVHRSICFLHWYQDSLYLGSKPIVGLASSDAAITVIEKWNARSQRMEWRHRYLPEPNSTDPKLPISWAAISAIEEAIERKSLAECMPNRLMRAHQYDMAFISSLFDYLYARRNFMTWLLRRTGLRPGEMMLLSTTSLEGVVSKKFLEIPTLKRRRHLPPLRAFFFTQHDIEFIRRYLISRRIWLQICQKRNAKICNTEGLFLGTAPGQLGLSISLSALEKDFAELCVEARLKGQQGAASQQVCFSMYRHRFITEHVRRLMKEFGIGRGAVISQADYRAMLERVRAMTGHADMDSLFHYIDLARQDEDIWSAMELCERLQAASDLHRRRASEIARKLRNGASSTLELSALADELQELAYGLGDFC